MNDSRHTAYHEAGHAVLTRVMRLIPYGPSSIVQDHDSAGHGYIADPLLTLEHLEQQECWHRSYEAVMRGRIISFMAGRVAEEIILGHCEGGNDDDQLQIALMARTLYADDDWENRYQARLERHTRQLVVRHRQAIERVAGALLSSGTLGADEIDALMEERT